jgi:acyl carrier protein
MWQQILGVEKVGTDDNFFDLGGHSLLMMLVYNKLREKLNRDISMVQMFQYPTVNSLARFLSGKGDALNLNRARELAKRQMEAINRQKQTVRRAEEIHG